MPDSPDAAGLSYLRRLLRTALTQTDARTVAFAGRVVAPLLGVAAAQDCTELIAEVITPQPGAEATYEVQCDVRRGGNPTVLARDLNAGAALRAASRSNRDGLSVITVIGRTADGVERRALSRGVEGALEYLFPSPGAFSGPADAVQRALDAWDSTLRRWGSEVDAAMYAASDTVTAPAVARSVAEQSVASPDRFPTAAEIADAIQSSLMQMTVDINLNEVESLIRRTIESTFGTWTIPGVAGPVGAAAPLVPKPLSEADQRELAENIGLLVVDRVRAFLRPASDSTAERVASMVANQLDPLLRRPSGQGKPEDGPETLGARSEIAVTQRQLLAGVSSQVETASRILGAMEHIDLQVQELREYARMSSGALQSLTEQVAALGRRSEAAGERLAAAVGQELDQFGDRVRHRLAGVETAAKRTTAEGAAPEAVSRLALKLARAEVQLERLLERLDEPGRPDPRRPPR